MLENVAKGDKERGRGRAGHGRSGSEELVWRCRACLPDVLSSFLKCWRLSRVGRKLSPRVRAIIRELAETVFFIEFSAHSRWRYVCAKCRSGISSLKPSTTIFELVSRLLIV